MVNGYEKPGLHQLRLPAALEGAGCSFLRCVDEQLLAGLPNKHRVWRW